MSKKMQKPLAVALATTLAAGSVSTPAFAADAIDEGIQPPAAVETPLPADDESLQLDGEGEDDVIMSVTSADEADVPADDGNGDSGEGGQPSPQGLFDDERTVSSSFSEPTISQTESSDTGITGLDPEEYEGKQYIEHVNGYTDPTDDMLSRFHKHTYTNDDGKQEVVYYPIVMRSQEDFDLLPDQIKALYEFDPEADAYVPVDAQNAWNDTDSGVEWDYVFTNGAEYTMSGNVHIVRGTNDKPRGVVMAVLNDRAGNRLFAYCMDAEKSTSPGVLYSIENIESADYFPGTKEEQIEAKKHVRAAAQKGYWGTRSGVGSLDQLKKDLKAALADGMYIEFTFLGREGGVNNVKEITYSSTEDLAELLAMVDSITEGEALNATQAAIWKYANNQGATVDEIYLGVTRSYTTIDGVTYVYNGEDWEGTQDEYDEFNCAMEARMELIRAYLTSDYLKDKVSSEEIKPTIITSETFLPEDAFTLNVGDRVKGLAANKDDNQDNDVYNADLSFKLVVAPTEKDDLVVSLVDSNGVVIRQAYIGKNAILNDDGFVCQDGVYTFKNVQLSENSDVLFNLKMQGVQHLEQGVYMFEATGGTKSNQTLIGIGQGAKDVNVNANLTLRFDVDDPNPEPDDDFGVSGDEDPFPDKDPGNDPDKDPDSDPDGNPEGGADSDGEAGNDPSSGNVTQFNDDSSASVDVYSESKASETPDTSDSVASVVASGILASISASALALFTRRRKSE